MKLTDDELNSAVNAELTREIDDQECGTLYMATDGNVSYEVRGQDHSTSDQSPLTFLTEIGNDLEQAVLAKTKAKKVYRRAYNALAKAQAIAVTMGEVENSLAGAGLGKNDFNRKHALTLLADKEQQTFMDAEDDLDDATDQLMICNNRAIQFGLLR